MECPSPLSFEKGCYALFDVLTSQVIFVGPSSHPSPFTEYIEKQDGIVVSHTVSIYSESLNLLILKLSDYVRNSQNEAE